MAQTFNPMTHRNRDEKTPLHLAAEEGKTMIVRMLIEMGADVMAQDKMDQTPLHLAARNGHDSTMKALLDDPLMTRNAIQTLEWSMNYKPRLVSYRRFQSYRFISRRERERGQERERERERERDVEKNLKRLAQSLSLHLERARKLLEHIYQDQVVDVDSERHSKITRLVDCCAILEAGERLEKTNLLRCYATADDKKGFLGVIVEISRPLIDLENEVTVLERRLNVRMVNRDGNTALELATKTQLSEDRYLSFLQVGAALGDNHGKTLMQLAEEMADNPVTFIGVVLEWDWSQPTSTMLQQLLDIEADADTRHQRVLEWVVNRRGNSLTISYAKDDEIPLILSPPSSMQSWERDETTLLQLLQRKHVNWNTDEGQQALLLAATCPDHYDTTQKLASSGIGKLRLSKVLMAYLESPWYFSADLTVRMVKLFSDAGADMCATHDRMTMVFRAAKSNPGFDNYKVFRALLEAGAEVDQTVVDLLTELGKVDCLAELRAHKAQSNAQIND